MGCCGQRRADAAQQISPANRPVDSSGAVADLRFTQDAAALVRGPVTGRHYQFHNRICNQPIDARDAAILLKSGYFQLK
jgi:hypothetical protein